MNVSTKVKLAMVMLKDMDVKDVLKKADSHLEERGNTLQKLCNTYEEIFSVIIDGMRSEVSGIDAVRAEKYKETIMSLVDGVLKVLAEHQDGLEDIVAFGKRIGKNFDPKILDAIKKI